MARRYSKPKMSGGIRINLPPRNRRDPIIEQDTTSTRYYCPMHKGLKIRMHPRPVPSPSGSDKQHVFLKCSAENCDYHAYVEVDKEPEVFDDRRITATA